MKSITQWLVVIIIAGVTSYAVTKLKPQPTSPTEVNSHPSTFDRVTKTRILRCGYAVATPWFMVDANSGVMSGVGYDVTLAVAEKLGLTVEWVEETGWGVAEQGLQSGRYDMMCGSVCVDPRRTQAAYYSKPFVHIPILAFYNQGDDRFNTLADLNDPDVRIGVKTGHVFEFIANERFPLAEKVYLGDLSDDTEFMLQVRNQKADISFAGQETIDLYHKEHPHTLQTFDEPARFCNGAFMVPRGDDAMKHMIDAAITELNASQVLDRIVARYMPLDPRYVQLPGHSRR